MSGGFRSPLISCDWIVQEGRATYTVRIATIAFPPSFPVIPALAHRPAELPPPTSRTSAAGALTVHRGRGQNLRGTTTLRATGGATTTRRDIQPSRHVPTLGGGVSAFTCGFFGGGMLRSQHQGKLHGLVATALNGAGPSPLFVGLPVAAILYGSWREVNDGVDGRRTADCPVRRRQSWSGWGPHAQPGVPEEHIGDVSRG